MSELKSIRYLILSHQDQSRGMVELTFNSKKERDDFVRENPAIVISVRESYPPQITSLAVHSDQNNVIRAYIPMHLKGPKGKEVFDKKKLDPIFKNMFNLEKKIPTVIESSNTLFSEPQKSFVKTIVLPFISGQVGLIGAALSLSFNLSRLFLVGSIGTAIGSLLIAARMGRNYIYQKAEDEVINKPLYRNNKKPTDANYAYFEGIEAGRSWIAYFKKGYLSTVGWKDPLSFGAGMLHTMNETKKTNVSRETGVINKI